MLKGIPVSPGIVTGKVFFLDKEDFTIKKHKIKRSEVEGEIRRFRKAISETREELFKIKGKVSRQIGEKAASIFEAHLLLVEDPLLTREIIQNVGKNLFNVEYVIQEITKKLTTAFSSIDDLYLQERAVDIWDVERRILRNLLGREREELAHLKNEVIVIAHDLSPSDTAQMHKEKVIGFATDIGGRTSHTAIMARSLQIPAVVGLKNMSEKVQTGDTIIIDGNQGTVIINPGKKVQEHYSKLQKGIEILERKLRKLKDLPAETIDKYRVTLSANIEVPEEIGSALKHGAEGIGLYRTEFFYLNRSDLPDEEEQFFLYKEVARKMKPHSVIIRTLDLGGDKFLSHLELPQEMNPFMGWRAIRLCLEHKDIFKAQLRAILRARVYGNLKIMYPLISGIEEFRQAQEILREVKRNLEKEGLPFKKDISVGVMIEVPSAALIADILAKEADFFSLGTNDLIQYTLAIDRVNEKIAYLYQPLHPAVLRLIKGVVEAAHKEGIWVGMCGEMASDISFTPILVGLGISELSMGAVSIPEVKKIIRSITLKEAQEIVNKILKFSTIKEINRFLNQELKKKIEKLIGN
jgi:phosphotransferase system enzyme I (PtsI)